MTVPSLSDVLRMAFPGAVFDAANPDLSIGAFPEWDSLAHFNLLLLIEETYGVRFSKEQLAELKSLSQITAALAAMDRRQKRSPQEHKMAKASGLDWPGKVKEGLIQAGIRVGDTVCLHVDALVAAQFPPMSPPSALRS